MNKEKIVVEKKKNAEAVKGKMNKEKIVVEKIATEETKTQRYEHCRFRQCNFIAKNGNKVLFLKYVVCN